MRVVLCVLALFMWVNEAKAGTIGDNLRQFREYNAPGNGGARWNGENPEIKNEIPSKPQPVVQQPKTPSKPQPVVQQPKAPVQPQSPHKEPAKHDINHHDKHVDNHHHKPHPQPNPHRKTTVYEAPLINHYTYVVSTPEVSYVTSGEGVIYNSNPHIYSPKAYGCKTLKNDIRYCTDSIGKALTGRIVQDYTETIAYENYKNGYLEGETYIYTPNGTLLQVTNYSRGLKNGKETVYFGNGKVHYVAHYSKGLLNGDIKQYDISGNLLGEMRYRNGRYNYRYCRNDTQNDFMRERIKANEKNELILCADY